MNRISDAEQRVRALTNEQGMYERYIRLYGTFQAVILQQDAIKEIYDIYVGSKPTILKESGWQRCRRLRNLATGHPLDAHGSPTQGKLRIFLSRVTITERGFDLLICQEKDPARLVKKSIDFIVPYNSYKEEALGFLREVQATQADMAATL